MLPIFVQYLRVVSLRPVTMSALLALLLGAMIAWCRGESSSLIFGPGVFPVCEVFISIATL